MTYSKILSIGLGIYLSLLLLVFIVTGGSRLVNVITIGLTFILMAEMQFSLRTITRRNAPLSLLFITLVFLFFGAPVLGYLLYPDRFLQFYSVEEVNRALLYVILGSGTAILGIKYGSNLFTSVHDSTGKDPQSRPFFCSPRVLFAIAVANMGVGIWMTLGFGKSSTLIINQGGEAFMFLSRLANLDVVMMIILILAIEHWPRLNKSDRKLLILGAAMIVLMNTLGGSRAALFNLSLFVLILLADKKGNFRVGRRAAILVVLAIPVSVLVFPLATGVRSYWNMTERLGDYHGSGSSIVEFIQAVAGGGDEESPNQFEALFYPVLYRLNGLDPVVMVTSYNREGASLDINLVNEFKSFVNIITPGDPFPGIRETSRMFLFVYQGRPIEYLDLFYVTSMYSLWGICYADFGYIGGLLATGSFMFLMAGVYQWLTRLKTRFNTYWRIWGLLFAYYLILSLGLDRSFAFAIYVMISGVFWLAILARLSPSRRIDLVDKSLERPERPPVASLAYDATVSPLGLVHEQDSRGGRFGGGPASSRGERHNPRR